MHRIETRWRTRLVAASVLAVASCAGQAFAADIPDLVGSWQPLPETHVSVRLGAANDYSPEYSTPTGGDAAWTMVFEAQDGRVSHGYALSPTGAKEPFVAVLTYSLDRLLISGLEWTSRGEFVEDGRIEFCYQDQEPGRASVDCSLAAKE